MPFPTHSRPKRNGSPTMKTLCLLLALSISPSAAFADPITIRDMGTYQILGKDRAPIDMFYRLSRADGAWKMEGKQPGGAWNVISCAQGCGYETVSQAEAKSFLPATMSGKFQIDCIKNMAQAFCRYTPLAEPTQVGYVVVALVTGRPLPIFLQRTGQS